MSDLRTRIQEVLDRADDVDATWAKANDKAEGCPTVKACQADDDARRSLSEDAVEILRCLLRVADSGDDLNLAEADPELIIMQWDGGEEEEGYEDEDLYLDDGETYTVCPRCLAVNAEIFEIDESVRWNRTALVEQPDETWVHDPAAVEFVMGPNPLAGLPMFDVHQGDGNYDTTGHACGACRCGVELPEWLESTWS